MVRHTFVKDLSAGSYDLLVLDVLREGRGYGYDIVKRVHAQSHRLICWQKGSLYRVLHDLERRRLIVGAWSKGNRGRKRRYYRLTERGRRAWREQRGEWRQFSRGVNAVLGLE